MEHFCGWSVNIMRNSTPDKFTQEKKQKRSKKKKRIKIFRFDVVIKAKP